MITHNKSCCDSSIKPQSHQADAYTENSYTNQILVESNYLLSDEVDEKGNLFVLTSGDHLEFGVIEENTSLTPAPFQLSEGVITNPKTNDGYGLAHIEARHGDQIRKKGYKTVIDFIEDIAKNYEVIREGNLRNGNKTYLIQLAKKRYNYTLIVELSEDGTYWSINTAGILIRPTVLKDMLCIAAILQLNNLPRLLRYRKVKNKAALLHKPAWTPLHNKYLNITVAKVMKIIWTNKNNRPNLIQKIMYYEKRKEVVVFLCA